MKHKQKRSNAFTTLALMGMLASGNASALVFNFINGSDLYATLEVTGNTNFDLEFVGENVASGGFINELWLDGPNGTFTDNSTDTAATGTYSLNGYNGGGGAGSIYDWEIQFPNSNKDPADRLTIGEHALWSITDTNPTDWSLSKIHINAFDINGNSIKLDGCLEGRDCDTTEISEPGTLVLLGLGLAGLGLTRRRSRS
jgi:hypothetical protein